MAGEDAGGYGAERKQPQQLLRRVNSYDFRGHPELVDMQTAMKAAHAAHRELCEAIMSELGV